MNEPPHRLCCGRQHWGPQCPDGKVMCCLCFERFEIAGLSVDPASGRPWDVCVQCREDELRASLPRGPGGTDSAEQEVEDEEHQAPGHEVERPDRDGERRQQEAEEGQDDRDE